MKYLQNTSTDPHFNMAFDEFCLDHLKADEPVFYLWRNRPSVIIGLNQSAYAEVNLPFLEKNGIVLARRVTGGGATPKTTLSMPQVSYSLSWAAA